MGKLIWRASHGRVKKGAEAGSLGPDGYIRLQVCGSRYLGHRLAWYISTGKWPKDQIDHINGIRDDNRISNLRECTSQQNNHNQNPYKNKLSIYKGVSWHKKSSKWRSQIMSQEGYKHLGIFNSELEAANAYDEAAKKLHKEFAKTNFM